MASSSQSIVRKMGSLFNFGFWPLLCYLGLRLYDQTVVNILLHGICTGVTLRGMKGMKGDELLSGQGESNMEERKHSGSR